MMSASNSKAISNVLSSGQILHWNDKLGYPNSKVSLSWNPFCNLVLYDDKGVARWKSGSGGWYYRGCTLSLNENGRLYLTGILRDQVWISDNANSVAGKYVAVLLPEAKLVIYGPPIWGVGEPTVKESSIDISGNSDINNNEMVVSSMTNQNNIPAIRNVLISGRKLYNGDNITENGYIFILDDCELILKDSRGTIKWQTETHDYGINCYASLDNKGVLAIFDKYNPVPVWTNDEQLALPQPSGEYALIMQSNGTATIYGPAIWSRPTKPSSSVLIPRDDFIKMPIVEM